MSGDPRRRLARRTWRDVGRDEVLLVPVGSTEQHGPHLPLDTDTVVAVAVAEAAAAALRVGLDRDVVVAPAVVYGSSGEHQSFAGTLSIGTHALRVLLVELVRSAATWADRVVLVNGHGGNLDAVTGAVTQLVHEGLDVDWVPCATEDVDLHAGRTETSLMLHLRPDSVHLDLAEAGCTSPLAELLPLLRAGGVAAVSPNGVLGDPAGASADEGARVLAAMAHAVVRQAGTRHPAARR
ncbi:mycofactocin biosynthesis peptidyl-dipeptidase MftE [Solicola sp. PLA-1-18]|uniref:mycofactocin biosynthesis peptidyl-dipeptidase MftE n=1 Tax=Solicola sp. PLA-1-18 TaxID=3380532 RepID=UPI003B7F0903